MSVDGVLDVSPGPLAVGCNPGPIVSVRPRGIEQARPAWLRVIRGLWSKLGSGLKAQQRELRVEERLMLGGRKSAMVLACHGRRFLLVSAGDAIGPLVEVLPLGEQPHPRTAEERQ